MSDATTVRPKIALTLGDPAGVGPELAARLLSNPANLEAAEIYILADRSELDAAAAVIGVTIPLSDEPKPGFATLLDDDSRGDVVIPEKQVSKEAGERALHQLRRGIAMANAGEIGALVFTPLNKTSLHLGGMHEEDELRWFAKELHYDGVTSEINIIPGMWTARVTSHIGIRDVADRITRKGVTDAIRLLNDLLHDSGVEKPRLGVCALNPHNGENGIFGREEIDVIKPGIDDAVASGIDADGTYPSDTIFIGSKEKYDGIVTMYHDQGQIAIKLMGFDGGVTVQGGLPVVIATPAHGTAFDIAGEGLASVTSSQNALDIAIAVAGRRAARAVSA
ncbi:4-hydroxythreonine-4-phosphate dehydrogenase PdxA [Frondihabitans australicus]|uniref:4-hydroxythreonine-4-phosphate dehydrogenase n=1 Tax=Frondihabitans australicus TaxID=386892 RepID=A0A495IKQ0_9MICO|nr:4-hydroxythreonine-4-phosphate dehydrogenase PdxA [Frondihabitans australicus]RKR76544.1 4-hydroxythreonine-4-phosphate dehydrogenase [Frondihabitans australicus]